MRDDTPSLPTFAPLADGACRPSAQVVQQAAEWMARLQDDSGEEVRLACERWRAAHADHECAWRRLADLARNLSSTRHYADANLVDGTLARSDMREQRRGIIKLALLLAGAGGLGWQAVNLAPPGWLAAYQTGVGERRTLTLADGTRVDLNTDTAIDVSVDGQTRDIWLRRGEILVATGHDAQARPLRVHTESGDILPIGTRFTVRQFHGGDRQGVRVAVLEGAVRLVPREASAPQAVVHAGQAACFDTGRVQAVAGIDDASAEASWLQGMIVAVRMPLARFAAELGRYRSGLVQCEGDVAHLSVTGAFPVQDTDAALRMLEEVLPVRIRYRTRYWVQIRAS